MGRFVRPETRTLALSEGDTIVVRARVNNGEQRAMYARIRAHPDQVGEALVTAYLLDWSLRDHDGRPVHVADLSRGELEAVLESLTPETFTEILEAVTGHDTAQREAAEAEKKTRSGVGVS